MAAFVGVIYALVTHLAIGLKDVPKFHVSNDRILDEYNRECFFHGLNVVYKSPPYLPETDHFDPNLSFSIEDMELLNSLGQNVIRLGVMWPGVEPQKNQINNTYINNAISIINKAYTNYNITSLIDNHQDTFSEALCGEGVPIWATQPEEWNFPEPLAAPYQTNNNHIPSQQDCAKYVWYDYLDTNATSSAFQRLYQNYNQLRDSFADHWGLLAARFKSVPGVIGFELINEPWPGDIFADPTLINPGVADQKNLQPFYDAIAPSIYGNDSDRMIFFESSWYNLDNVTLEVGFDHVPGGNEYSNQSVLAFHYYNPPCRGSPDQYFNNRSHDGMSLNSTSFLTEFGIGGTLQQMSNIMDICDKYFVSWTGWEYKPLAGSLPNGTCTGCGYGVFKKDGSINENVVKAISRTYAQKVAGNTKVIAFDWKNGGNFTLVFNMNTDITEPTVIYTSLKYWYPNGYNLNIKTEKNAVTYKSYGNFIEIYNSNDNKFNKQEVIVTVDPK